MSKNRKIIWVVPDTKVEQASFRIRSLYVAHALELNFGSESIFVTTKDEALGLLVEGCHLVFVKNWTKEYIDLAYEARKRKCSVYLDVCDNLVDEVYKDNVFNSSSEHIKHFSNNFDKIIVPTSTLAELINKTIIGTDKRTPAKQNIVIIPDIAEERDELIDAIEYMSKKSTDLISKRMQEIIGELKQIKKEDNEEKRLLWFGNAYSPTSNMGISSIIPHLGMLRKMQNKCNFELVICTNKNTDLSILREYDIKYRQVDWSLVAIYNEVLKATACFLTTGNDSRCKTKSNNRILLALANKCPVIAISLPNADELKDVIQTSLKGGIQRYFISEERTENRMNDIRGSQELMKRFKSKSIASIYDLLFKNQEGYMLANKYKLKNSLSRELSTESKKHIDTNENLFPENIPGPVMPCSIEADDIDLLFVCGISDKNWILEGIAKEIGSRSKLKWAIYYAPKKPENIPKSRNVMFMHQLLLSKFINKRLINDERKVYCWYTHPRDETQKSIQEQKESFSKCEKVFFACSMHKKLWLERGLDTNIAMLVLGGFDKNIFKYRERNKNQSIGICSSFYERKNPKLIHEVVSRMKDKHFFLIGKNWHKYTLFEELLRCGNLTYLTLNYTQYYYYYSKMSVFLSTSKIEGGPIPLMEAMASNCFPVVSDTGFATDVIKNNKNGFIFPIEEKSDAVCTLLRRALEANTINISKTVEEYSWDSFSRRICSFIS